VELRPVDSEATPLDAAVDSETTLLVVALRPVDSDATPLEAEVDSELT
jgi:pilus assembly protein FimV